MSLKHYLPSLAFAALVAVSTHAQSGEIAHEMGTTMVPDAPERIVVLEFSYIDALASLGVAPVGIADDKKRERVAPYTEAIGDDWVSVGTRKTPSLEVIASLQPDLIIADKTRHSAAYDALSEIAPTIVLDSLSGDYPASIEQMSIIGKAIGRSEAMEARIAEHKATMAKLIAEMKATGDYTAQFGVVTADSLSLHSPVSYNGSLLRMFGFGSKMEAGEAGVHANAYVATSLEQLSEIDPDILIFGKYADPGLTDSWQGEPLYEQLSAVRNGRVFYVTAHNWSRLRGMLAAELTARDLVGIMQQID